MPNTYDENGALLVNLTGSIAPVGAQYVVMALDGTLTNERVLTGTANQVIVTDGGAGGPATLSTPQDIATTSAVQFATVTVPNAGWVGAGVGCAWLYDSATPDISTPVNVGIGQTAPGTLLEVGDGTGSPVITINKDAAGTGRIMFDRGADNDWYIEHTVGEGFVIAGVKEDENFNIVVNDGGVARTALIVDASNANFEIWPDGDGLVGIGTATPGSLTEWNFADDDIEFVDAHAATAVGSISGVIEAQRGGATAYIALYDGYS